MEEGWVEDEDGSKLDVAEEGAISNSCSKWARVVPACVCLGRKEWRPCRRIKRMW